MRTHHPPACAAEHLSASARNTPRLVFATLRRVPSALPPPLHARVAHSHWSRVSPASVPRVRRVGSALRVGWASLFGDTRCASLLVLTASRPPASLRRPVRGRGSCCCRRRGGGRPERDHCQGQGLRPRARPATQRTQVADHRPGAWLARACVRVRAWNAKPVCCVFL